MHAAQGPSTTLAVLAADAVRAHETDGSAAVVVVMSHAEALGLLAGEPASKAQLRRTLASILRLLAFGARLASW